MISYIKGTLVHRGNGVVVVEASGLGYEIFVSAATLSVLPEVGETVKIHTHMNFSLWLFYGRRTGAVPSAHQCYWRGAQGGTGLFVSAETPGDHSCHPF